MSVSTHFIVGGEKMFKSFLIKYAEIGVKGKNRYIFENALVDNAKRALDKIDGDFSVTKENGRIYAIANAEYDFDEAVNNIFTEDIEKRMKPYIKKSKIHVFSI